MLRLKLWHLIVLTLFVPYMLGSKGCPGDKTDTPSPPEPCGVGQGEFGASTTSVPSGFDCNTAGSFEVELEPAINDSYAGFNRLYFTLKKGSSTYRSNYVEFYSDQEEIQQLEWGGSLASGEYKATAFLENIQLNSTCEDSIYEDWDCDLGKVDITQFTNPQKVMEIEYFCQTSYNVFSSPNTAEYMDIAFNIANTRDNVIIYDTDLTPQIIEYEPYQGRKIKDYIFALKQWENEMFLCGIKAFKDTEGNLLPDRLGATCEDNWVTRAPSCSTGSLVAVKTCIDFAASDEYRLDYNDLVTAMTIHELGLQRGAVADEHYSTYPDPKFCIGHSALIVWLDQEGKHPYWAVRYSNPHFCEECITGIKNIGW